MIRRYKIIKIYIQDSSFQLINYTYFPEMTDQQQQETTHFKRRLNNYLNIQFKLLANQDSFFVKILNLVSLQYFEQVISSSYLQNHKELNCYFETPKDLMIHLQHHFKDLNISDKGIIMFNIKYSDVLPPKSAALNIAEKKMDKVELINTKMENMKERFDEQLSQKEKTIDQLRREVLKMKDLYQQSNKITKNLLFYTHAHPSGHQNQYFSTKSTEKSIIVHHNYCEQPEGHIFVFNHEIIVGTIKRYTLKVLNSESIRQLCFCFGPKLILNHFFYNGPQIATYECNGNLLEGGVKRDSQVVIGIGDKFQCELNLIDNRINWIKDGNHFATTELTEQMRNKSLYFALIFCKNQEEIEVMID